MVVAPASLSSLGSAGSGSRRSRPVRSSPNLGGYNNKPSPLGGAADLRTRSRSRERRDQRPSSRVRTSSGMSGDGSLITPESQQLYKAILVSASYFNFICLFVMLECVSDNHSPDYLHFHTSCIIMLIDKHLFRGSAVLGYYMYLWD